MKDATEKVGVLLFMLAGGFIGFLFFAFSLEGWGFVLQGDATRPWNGLPGLILCAGIGGAAGWFVWRRDMTDEKPAWNPFGGHADAALFSKRLMAVAGGLAVLYFLWQVAAGI